MNKRALAAIRLFSPKLAQQIELRDKEIATRPAAYQNAYDVAEVAGPMKMAEDLDLVGLPLEQLAAKAAEDYHPEARAAATEGTLDGFRAYMDQGKEQVESL